MRPDPEPAVLGAGLGLANLAFVAFAIVWVDPHLHEDAYVAPFLAIAAFGFIPSLIVGTFTGRLAGATARWSVPARFAVLGVFPVALVYMLGTVVRMDDLIVPSLIPTAVALVILEKRTREVLPPAVTHAVTVGVDGRRQHPVGVQLHRR